MESSRTRYKLKKDEGNYYDLRKNHIRLNIPITVPGTKLKYERAVNISSTVLNAILIHLKGDSKCTPKKPVIDSIETKIKFKDVGIDPTRIQNDPNLLVVIFNNETLKQEDTVEFRLVVNGSQNYNEALEEILAGNKGCPEDVIDPILQPREQNGDVIGG